MPANLGKILISQNPAGRHQALENLHRKLFSATYFETGDERNLQLSYIIDYVRKHGDDALQEFTEKFDGVRLNPENFRISKAELQAARSSIDKQLLQSIRKSIKNVETYQKKIFIGKKSFAPNPVGIRYTPVKRAGLCVPGASAPLPSTVIMTAVPAIVAGVKEIVVVSPPRFKESINPVILAVCAELGIDEVYRIGGAQAVAALAFGTNTIRPVNKIVGPGNQWTQMAKRAVFGRVDIDSIAGPSEVLIIANDKANPAWIAADMLSQAEHAPGSALLFTDSQHLAENVVKEIESQVVKLVRANDTIKCLEDFCGIVVFENLDQCIEQANNFASEHLQIQCGKLSRKVAAKIENAGAIFIGDFTPVAVGDYWAGPSHTLPTGGTAKFFSALTANDFLKSVSLIEYDKKKLLKSADDIIRLAQTEGLDAHAKSVQIRRPD